MRADDAARARPTPPSQSYTYRTDQELVQASQTASASCPKSSSQPMTSSIVTNSDGTKTVTFQCGPAYEQARRRVDDVGENRDDSRFHVLNNRSESRRAVPLLLAIPQGVEGPKGYREGDHGSRPTRNRLDQDLKTAVSRLCHLRGAAAIEESALGRSGTAAPPRTRSTGSRPTRVGRSAWPRANS